MATIRNTTGSLFGMVSQTANTVTSAVNALSDGIDILQSHIESAKVDQRDQQVVHRKTYRDQLIHDASMEVADRNMEAVKYIAQSADHAAQYQSASSMFKDCFLEV